MGFSHTHLSGTGCGDLLDFLVMPGIGAVKLVPGPRSKPEQGYRSRFSHAREVVRPGYYSVPLEDPGILAELTATERVGLHRYTFPASTTSWIIVDLHHGYEGGGKPNVISAELSPDRTRHARRRADYPCLGRRPPRVLLHAVLPSARQHHLLQQRS